MIDINKAILVGRLGAEPVLRATSQGTAVAHFPLATSRRVRGDENAGEEFEQETQWHRVIVWGKQADTCAKYLKKGQAVYVEGSIRSRRYKSEEGDERSISEIHAERLSFLGKGRSAGLQDEAQAETRVESAVEGAVGQGAELH